MTSTGPRSKTLKWRVAYHEAGHAVAALGMGEDVDGISVAGAAWGISMEMTGGTWRPGGDNNGITYTRCRYIVPNVRRIVLLAGQIAEQKVSQRSARI